MSYRVRVQGASAKPRDEVEAYLSRLPGVRREAEAFLYADEEEDVTIEIRAEGDAAQVNRLDVIVPVEVSAAAAERLAAFCAGLANRFGWQALDAVSGAALSENDLRRRFAGTPLVPPQASGCFSILAALSVLLLLLGVA